MLTFLPALGPIIVFGWITLVHIECYRAVKEAYRREGKDFRAPFGIDKLFAWSFLVAQPDDSKSIVMAKNRIRDEAKHKLRYAIPIFFVSFFGLAIIVTILYPR